MAGGNRKGPRPSQPLLFLGSGAIIHAMSEEQDIRKYGGLVKYLPFTYTM
ncbi:NADH dehydrogenase subunit 5, partial (mitochondrion) [Neolecta irregularis DAH-3]